MPQAPTPAARSGASSCERLVTPPEEAGTRRKPGPSSLTYQPALPLLVAVALPGAMFGDSIPRIHGDATGLRGGHAPVSSRAASSAPRVAPHPRCPQAPTTLVPSMSVSTPHCISPPSPPPAVPYISGPSPVATAQCPPCPQHLHMPTTPHAPATTPPPAWRALSLGHDSVAKNKGGKSMLKMSLPRLSGEPSPLTLHYL